MMTVPAMLELQDALLKKHDNAGQNKNKNKPAVVIPTYDDDAKH
jgi:hypothetical protein